MTTESISDQLDVLVNDIQTKLGKLCAADFVVNGRAVPPDAAILIKLELNSLSERLTSILGESTVKDFYEAYEPKGVPASLQLALPLAHLISECCTLLETWQVSLDTARLHERLTRIAECVSVGEMTGTYSLRVLNIDIEHEFDFADGIRFAKLSRDSLEAKYPIDRRISGVSTLVEEYWPMHRVEAAFTRRGRPVDFQRGFGIRETGALVNSIVHAFLLADIPKGGSSASVTHVRLETPIESSSLYLGFGGISLQPHMLSNDEVTALRESYGFLKECGNDRVLQTAVDRFIIGRKRGEHHPNRVNEPNWDKLVDYVIAMETLFLTADGNPVTQELGYRFRINGSSLLRACAGHDVRKTFHSLKDLYEIRSKVVHGSDDSTILKPANKFISRMGIEDPNRKHPLGRLTLILATVENWVKTALLYLGSMPQAARPYRRTDGWEDMLWGEQSA
jgi:hypothetical protein